MKKLSVILKASEYHKICQIELDNLNITEKDWDKLNKTQKLNLILNEVAEFEQPYWTVEAFGEKND